MNGESEILTTDTAVIGAGPAGLAAAAAVHEAGGRAVLIEREERPGGILKQCIHDGFGLVRYRERLTGPEYAAREVARAEEAGVPIWLETFVIALDRRPERKGAEFELTLSSSSRGIFTLRAGSLILAAGCRERSARQIFLHGSRPAGVFTAGLAQYFINIQGYLPAKRCVILGSGDIGLIMARRLTLEGVEVEGVYEVKPEPSGLTRNIRQCLEDYQIPLHLSTTVTEVHGRDRVESVTLARVDERGRPVPGSEREVECDALILSVGLIPENDSAFPLGLELDPATKGPRVDQTMMTGVPGLFSCGNALHVNDLVDYVSESGDLAGTFAARWARNGGADRPEGPAARPEGPAARPEGPAEGPAGSGEAAAAPAGIPLETGDNVLYALPQVINLQEEDQRPFPFYFRSRRVMKDAELLLEARVEGRWQEIRRKQYAVMKPPEMERLMMAPQKIPAGAAALRLQIKEQKEAFHA